MPENYKENQHVEQCIHHWVIQKANGPTSSGACILCGSVKEFQNHIQKEDFWDHRAPMTPGGRIPKHLPSEIFEEGYEYEDG